MKKRSTWRAQLKMNGQRNVIYISPEFEVQLWNRHHEHHKNYTFPNWLLDELKSVVKTNGKWMVIDGELLHAKDTTTKNIFYWWDLLVCNNEYLVGVPYEQRYQMLRERVEINGSEGFVSKATEHIWIADMIPPEHYDKAWEETATSYVEGFVLKDIKSKLAPCINEKSNGVWQVRCRKPHSGGVYQF